MTDTDCPLCGAIVRSDRGPIVLPAIDVDRLVDAICAAEKATGWDLNVGEGPLAEAIAAAYDLDLHGPGAA